MPSPAALKIGVTERSALAKSKRRSISYYNEITGASLSRE